MWKLLILLGIIGCNTSTGPQGRGTYYPAHLGMCWTYQRIDRTYNRIDTLTVTVVDQIKDTSVCAMESKFGKRFFSMIRNQDTMTYSFPLENDWKLLDWAKDGDTWYYSSDYYAVITSSRQLTILGNTYNVIQTYKSGTQEAVYFSGLNVGIVKMFLGKDQIWNLISLTNKKFQ